MAQSFDNHNRVALWQNEYKEEGTRQPDLKGHGEFECEHCRKTTPIIASGWYRREDASPRAPEVSVTVQARSDAPPPRPRPEGATTGRGEGRTTPPATRPKPATRDVPDFARPDFDDDIPF